MSTKKCLIKFFLLNIISLTLVACENDKITQASNENLINKVNLVEDRWVNYKGISENNKAMMQSQFIPYNPENDYEVSRDTYVSYFNGEDFIKTKLYKDTPDMLNTIEEADGIILSFNKNNKNGMQLVEIE